MPDSDRPVRVTPCPGRVAVRLILPPQTTQWGLILPPSPIRRTDRGVVVACGGDLKESLQIGDLVLFGRGDGVDVDDGGVPHRFLRESQILAVLGEA